MMKMNGYSLPVQVFSVKKNSSLTRLEISLNSRARDFGRYSKCANWSPARSNFRRSNGTILRHLKTGCVLGCSKRHRPLTTGQQLPIRQFAHFAQPPTRTPHPCFTKKSAPERTLPTARSWSQFNMPQRLLAGCSIHSQSTPSADHDSNQPSTKEQQ